jgi:epoxyqueuosine reductase QueG
LPAEVRYVLLLGNAGPAMFERFLRERREARESLDDWARRVIEPLAAALGARAVFAFDQPFPPVQAWARRAGAGFASPLGLNIHPRFGLWHAFRAALLFPVPLDLPPMEAAEHPCERCEAKPCLATCPVRAFTPGRYDTAACSGWLASDRGGGCMSGGCLARRACPVGREYAYDPAQARFHMQAFLAAMSKGN